MYTQTYDVGSKAIIDLSVFGDKGKVLLTYIPEWEELFLESDEYFNDPIVFTSHSWEEDKMFLNSLKTNENSLSQKISKKIPNSIPKTSI